MFLFFQVLSDYLVKKLETEPSIYPWCSVCSCRRSQLPHTALGVTPGLTWGDHPYGVRGSQPHSCSPWGRNCCFTRWSRVDERQSWGHHIIFWLQPQRWKTSNLSPSHPSPWCDSQLFKNKHKNVWMKFFLRSQPTSLSLHPLQGIAKSVSQWRVIYFMSFNLPQRVLICPGDQFILDFKKSIYLSNFPHNYTTELK